MASPIRSCVALFLALALFCASSAHFCGDDNCFELLKVDRKASKLDIRRSYRKLSQTMHPDKRPGVPKAAEEFRAIGRAYETLLDDEKRRTYEDFLDNPLKYPQYMKESYYYAPKSNAVVVFVGIIGLLTLVHWLQMNRTYVMTKERMRESMDFRREVSRLVKSKAAPNKEAAAAMIDLDNIGIPKPNWRNLFVVKAAYLPKEFAHYVVWSAKWVFAYRIRKLEKSDDDKLYLIRKNMQKTPAEWADVSETDKKEFLDKGLEDPDECAEYLRLKRIELNKAGKLKKKKKHVPVPYSEVEDVNM